MLQLTCSVHWCRYSCKSQKSVTFLSPKLTLFGQQTSYTVGRNGKLKPEILGTSLKKWYVTKFDHGFWSWVERTQAGMKLHVHVCKKTIRTRQHVHVSDIFESPTFFFPDSNLFPSTLRIQIKFTCPHASDDIWIHSKETRPALCHHIGLLVSKAKRLDMILLCHRIKKYRDPPFTHYQIRCGFIFPLLIAD